MLPILGLVVWVRSRGREDEKRPLRHNAALYYALLGVFSFSLLLGPPFGPWQWVYNWPLLSFIRVPTRFSIVVMLALAVLSALAFDLLTRRWTRRRVHVAAGVLAVLIVAEFAAAPLAVQNFRQPAPLVDQWLAAQRKPFVVAEGPMPTDPGDYGLQNNRNATFMLHSMVHWQKTVHGFSGIVPDGHQRLYEAMAVFPSQEAIDRMRGFGVTYVVYHADMTTPEMVATIDAQFGPWAHVLELMHTEADGRVYKIKN